MRSSLGTVSEKVVHAYCEIFWRMKPMFAIVSFSIQLILKMSNVLGKGAWGHWGMTYMLAILAMVMLLRDAHKETLSKLHAVNASPYCLGLLTSLIESRQRAASDCVCTHLSMG